MGKLDFDEYKIRLAEAELLLEIEGGLEDAVGELEVKAESLAKASVEAYKSRTFRETAEDFSGTRVATH